VNKRACSIGMLRSNEHPAVCFCLYLFQLFQW
jgi:hypothetical protein